MSSLVNSSQVNFWRILGVASLVMGPLALNGAANQPDLIYDAVTGNVSINPDGTEILSFNWQSNDQFTSPADFTQLEADTFDIAGLSDNLPGAIGWVSALAASGQGYKGTNFNPATLGNIFPTGLDSDGLTGLLTNNAWAGPGGAGGAFDLRPRRT